MVRKNSKIYRILCSWLILLLVISIILGYIYYMMQPVIMRFAVSVAETVMLNSANQAVVNILKNEKFSYDDIAVLSKNEQGLVTSLEIDTYKINYLKSNIANEVSKIVEAGERYTVSIPMGTFLCNTYTNGFGPDIDFKMQMTSTAFVDFKHEFKSAGINQVLHTIIIEIDIRGSLIVAGYNKSIKAKTSTIATQTVIVGTTPDAFTNVIENENDNTAGLINDYGVLAGD